MSITAGDKIAKASAIRFVKSKNDTIGIQVLFNFEEEGVPARLAWTSWLTHGSLEFTMKTLTEVLEYNGDEETVKVAPGHPTEGMLANQDSINRTKEYKLVVEEEEYNGKYYPKIKFVNNLGGAQFAGCAPQVVKSHLNSIGFRAAFLSAKQGLPPKPKAETPRYANANLNAGAIPLEELEQQPMFEEEDLPY